MRIIDQDIYAEIILNRLHSSGNTDVLQCLLDVFDINAFRYC